MAQTLNSNSLVYFNASDIGNIANSLRSVTGYPNNMLVSEMPGIINNISSMPPNAIVQMGTLYEVGSAVTDISGLAQYYAKDNLTINFNNTHVTSANGFLHQCGAPNIVLKGNLDLSNIDTSGYEEYRMISDIRSENWEYEGDMYLDCTNANITPPNFNAVMEGLFGFSYMVGDPSKRLVLSGYFNNGDSITYSGNAGMYESSELYCKLRIDENLYCLAENICSEVSYSNRFVDCTMLNSSLEYRGSINRIGEYEGEPYPFDGSTFKDVYLNNVILEGYVSRSGIRMSTPGVVHGNFSIINTLSASEQYLSIQAYNHGVNGLIARMDLNISATNTVKPSYPYIRIAGEGDDYRHVVAWLNINLDPSMNVYNFFNAGIVGQMYTLDYLMYINLNANISEFGERNAIGHIFDGMSSTTNKMNAVVDARLYNILLNQYSGVTIGMESRNYVYTEEPYVNTIEFNFGNYSKFVNVNKRFYNNQLELCVYCEAL